MKPIVYLVGAGPGDPGLLTLKGKKILETADVVIYDSLVNTKLLDHVKKNAELIYVGKKLGSKEASQKEINNLLVKKAKTCKTVARLKGGDPFVFGRGGEEAMALVDAGITIEIVPGVSSISAVPAYSGIPLTHRSFNSSFAVITGHEDPFKDKSQLSWNSLAKMKTLIFLMSLNNLSKIMKKLIKEKIPHDTPVMITSWGTMPSQKTIIGTISNICKKLEQNKQITTPAVIVVGEIVNLRNEIKWFEKKPLFGKKILVTRASDQISEFSHLLNEYGADVIELPTIEIVPPKSWAGVDKSIKEFKTYDYIIFTSVNGVKNFLSRLTFNSFDSRIFHNKTIITIGEKTALELKKFGLEPDIIPKEYSAEGILDVLDRKKIMNKNFLIPRAKIARDLLPKKLKELNAKVNVVTCYENKLPKITSEKKREIKKMLKNNKIDVITFTSSSTVTNFFKIFNGIRINIGKVLIACIGPITAKTLKDHGLEPIIIAKKYTSEGLIEAMIDHLSNN